VRTRLGFLLADVAAGSTMAWASLAVAVTALLGVGYTFCCGNASAALYDYAILT